MDDFGFEPHHARVAGAAAGAAEAAVGVMRGEPEGAEAATAAAAVEAEATTTTTVAAAAAEADLSARPALIPEQPQPQPQPPEPSREVTQAARDERQRDESASASRRPPADGSVDAVQRRSDMPRPKSAQASAQNTPPPDEAEDGRGDDPEEAVPLPQAFTAQYLGSRPATGLWGVRHTRKPVDEMVAAARASPAPLPWTRLRVSASGVAVFHGGDAAAGGNPAALTSGGGGGRRTGAHGQAAVAVRALRSHDIAAISYGVQDLVYTRVFCFIVVTDRSGHVTAGVGPGSAPVFQCHAYVCESRMAARALTHALAAAFRAFSRELRRAGPNARALAKNRFKIDLRSPEQLAADLADTSDA